MKSIKKNLVLSVIMLLLSNYICYAQIKMPESTINYDNNILANRQLPILIEEIENLRFGPKEIWAYGSYANSNIYPGYRTPRMGDVNGDGLSDILLIYENKVVVRLSNGCEFGPEQDWFFGNNSTNFTARPFGFLVGDVNGDNLDDFITHSNQKIWVQLNPGIPNTLSPRQIWVESDYYYFFARLGNRLADLNNDGYSDFVSVAAYSGVHMYPSTGNSFSFDNNVVYSQSVPIEPYAYMDANNDGILDFYHEFDFNGESRVWVNLSNGSQFLDQPNYGHQNWEPKDGINVYGFADFNGDGKGDMVFKENTVMVKKSTGYSFTGYETWLNSNDFGALYRQYNNFVDVNGDGRADLVAFLDNRVEVRKVISDCETDLIISNNNQLTLPQNRGKNITTSGQLNLGSGQNAYLLAGQSIVLSPGFNAYAGSKLIAKILPCPNNAILCASRISTLPTKLEDSSTAFNTTSKSQSFDIIPNPSNGQVELFFEEIVEKTEVIVYDKMGISVYREILSPKSKNVHINLGNLNKGIYFIKVGSFLPKQLIIN